jgi:hypothetical protein
LAASFDAKGGRTVDENGVESTPSEKPADAAPTTPAPAPEKLLAGKYKTAEDLENAYKALEARLGAPKDTAATTPAPTPTDATQAPTDAPKGIDYRAIGDEIAASGDVSADTRAALAKTGMPDSMIDTVVQGLKNQYTEMQNQAYEVAGGKEQFEVMREWAKTNLSDTEKNFLQAQTAAGKEQAMLAVQALRSRYEAVNGKPPAVLVDGNKTSSNVGYESRYQMVADMRNPLYKADPAFRAKVEQRIMATTTF